MSALPPNWTKYNTDDGKAYFHNAVTNVTQWDTPESSGAGAPSTMSFDESSTSQVYQYKPEMDLGGSFKLDNQMVEISSAPSLSGSIEPAGVAQGGFVPTYDAETISLNAPGAASTAGFGGVLSGAISAATADDGGEAASGIAGSMLSYAQTLFDVSTEDVKKRLKLALVPYPLNDGEQNDFRTSPDFWGPFWVATTAIFCLAATGNFSRLVEDDPSGKADTKFKADYGLVGLAATMIYGALCAVPVLTRAALYFSGQEVDSINFRQMICVYGYSLAPVIPISLLCLLPFSLLRWLLIFIGLAVSLLFIRGNLWTDISVQAPSLKFPVIGFIAGTQGLMFLVYRMHFFNV